MAAGKTTSLHKVSVKQTPAARPAVVRAAIVHRPSMGETLGLRGNDDSLELNSSVALVIDQQTNEVLFSKNDSAVLPIASLTKLMTGLVVADAELDMNEMITITTDDIDTFKGSRSRLAVGTTLSRGELMHLALMSSENRAAHALGRTYPGGLQQFVRLMNQKAATLGMADTRYVEPTGLSSLNQSSARDLATLVSVAYQRPDPAQPLDLSWLRSRSWPPHAALQQFQRAHQESGMGDRSSENRVHLRSRPLSRDASQSGRPPVDHGVSGFGGQGQPTPGR